MSGSVSNLQQAVIATYLSELGRQPDVNGLGLYTGLLFDGVPLELVQLSIAHSAEAQSDINDLYLDILGRPVDPTGLAASTRALATGTSLAQLRANLAYAPEAGGAIGSLYKNVLDRPVDDGSLQLDRQALAGGASIAQLRAGLAASTEAAQVVSQAFQYYLDRNPSPSEVQFYTAALGDGASYGQIQGGLIESPENGQVIQGLYQQYLGRAASPAEVEDLRRMLFSGGTLESERPTMDAQGRLERSTVPDQTAALTTAYENVFGHAPIDAPNTGVPTIATLQDELALGRPFSAVTQVTDYRGSTPSGGFSNTYGYAVPAQYSDDGYSLFLIQAGDNLDPARFDTSNAPRLPVSGGTGATGPDTISLTLAQVLTAPITFIASLDGRSLGQATLPAASSFGNLSAGVVSFNGDFATGRELDLTFSAIPINGLQVASATLNGQSFLLGGAVNGAESAVSLFPHASSASVLQTYTYPIP